MKNIINNRQEKGITLIALVITIIILLILAGITISSLTQTGLFEKTNQAKERTIKAQLKEEIEMAIQEIQMEEIAEGRNVDLNSLCNGNSNGKGKLDDKLENIIVELFDDEITGEYKDYGYVIDDKLNVTIDGKVGIKPEMTYELSSTEPQQEEIIITVKATISEGEVTSIINPDNVEESKNEITYTVSKNGKYKFIAKSSTGTKAKITINITNMKISAPVINIIETGGYPILKSNGIVASLSKVEIVYEDNSTLINYYSEDNGSTWKEYNGIIETDKNVIMAKSVVKEDEQIKSDITTQNIGIPKDAIGVEAYDGDKSTFYLAGDAVYKYMEIDKSSWGGRLRILSEGYQIVRFLDENNEVLYECEPHRNNEYTYCIPENTAKLKYYFNENGGIYDMVIYWREDKLYVSTDGDDTEGTGTQANPYATIGRAVEQAESEDVIFIKEGTYKVPFKAADSDSSAAIYDMEKKLCIYGENEKTILICDGTNVSSRDSALFWIKNQDSIVRNLTTVYYPHRNFI